MLGYARVSSIEQTKGTSLQDQQAAIRVHAEARGLKVHAFFVEAESAFGEKIERRDQIRALLADVREDDLVLCALLDRWSRDMEFTLRSVREMKAKGASIYFVSENLDPSSEEGDTRLGLMAWAASEERKRIRKRMVGTRQLLRNAGYFCEGLPPIGYRRPHPKGFKGVAKNVLEIVPEEAEIVRRTFALCIAGRSVTQIASELDVNRDRVKDMLDRRLYTGDIKNADGEWIKGLHEPLIDAHTFARAREALNGRRLGGIRAKSDSTETSTWILRDVARCAHCGARMSAAYAGPKRARRYYFACAHRCTNKFVNVRRLEEAFEPMVVARLEELRDALAAGPEADESGPRPINFEERRARLQRRRERFLEAFADGDMTRDERRAALAKLDAERMKLDAEESERSRPRVLANTMVRRTMLKELGAIAKAWARATPQHRRTIVTLLARSVGIAVDTAPVPVWKSLDELVNVRAA